MKILAIGTSGKNCTVAISEDKQIIKELNINDGLTHSQNLLPTISNLFKEASLDISDIDLYACSVGPGSFTGIRIGVATLKGICFGSSKKVVPVPSLLALAYNEKDFEGDYIVSCIDAKNDNVYAGIYKKNEKGYLVQVGEYIVDTISTLTKELKKLEGMILLVGDASILVSKELKSHNVLISKHDLEYASKIIDAAVDLYEQGVSTDGVHLTPLYLKKSQAERELEEKK